MNWQPIETAPDNRNIFLFDKSYGATKRCPVQVGRWHQPSNPIHKGFWSPMRNPTLWAEIEFPEAEI